MTLGTEHDQVRGFVRTAFAARLDMMHLRVIGPFVTPFAVLIRALEIQFVSERLRSRWRSLDIVHRRRAAANSLPTRLAAKLWRARTDPGVGDDPWERGCKDVAEYVTASDLRHWIRRQEPGISESYAKKLVSRTIDAVLDLSKNRLAVRRTTQRKNGLEYTERRLLLPADASIPGATSRDETADPSDPETADVHG